MAAQAALEYGPIEQPAAGPLFGPAQQPAAGPAIGGHQGGHYGPWKVELIPVFEGSEGPYSNAGRLWLDKLLRVALRAGWDEDTKLDVALIRMSGEAQTWADSREFLNFHDFREAFEYRFCRTPPNALLLLNNCVQGEGESVGRYSDRFRQICRRLHVDVDLPLLVTQYVQGLKASLCKEVFRAKPANFQAALEEATYLETLEQHHVATPRVPTAPSLAIAAGQPAATRPAPPPRLGGGLAVEGMNPPGTAGYSAELSEITKQLAKLQLLITQNNGRRTEPRRALVCNYCHREGHIESDCRTKSRDGRLAHVKPAGSNAFVAHVIYKEGDLQLLHEDDGPGGMPAVLATARGPAAMDLDHGPVAFDPEAGLRPRKRAALPLREAAENIPYFQQHEPRVVRAEKHKDRAFVPTTDPTKRLAQYILDKAVTPSNFSLQDFVRLDPRRLTEMVIQGIRPRVEDGGTGPAAVAAANAVLSNSGMQSVAPPCAVNAALDASGVDYTFTWVNATIGTVPIRAIIDTGSSLSLISLATARKLGLIDCLESTSLEIFNAGGQKMVPVGMINNLPITLGPLTQRHSFVVVNVDAYDVVLGIDFLEPLKVKIDMAERALRVRMDQYTSVTIPLQCGTGVVPRVNFIYRQSPPVDLQVPPLEPIEESEDEGVDWLTEPPQSGNDDQPQVNPPPIVVPYSGNGLSLSSPEMSAPGSSVGDDSDSSSEVSPSDPEMSSHESRNHLPNEVLSLPEQYRDWDAYCAGYEMSRALKRSFPWHYGLMTEALIHKDFPTFNALVARYQCITSPWPVEASPEQAQQCSEAVEASLKEEPLAISDGRSIAGWEPSRGRDIYVLHVQRKGGVDSEDTEGVALPEPEQYTTAELEQCGYVLENGIPPHLQKDLAMLPLDDPPASGEPPELQMGPAAPPMLKHEFEKVMLTDYAELSSGIQGTEPRVNGVKVEHVILLDPPNHPPIACKPYRMSPAMEEICKQQVEEMLQKGVIEPSDSPWQFPVVMVRKKGLNSYRPCIDVRKLNPITRPLVYPMPHQDLILDKFKDARAWSLLDLEKGYWQVPLSKESRDYVSFILNFGTYRFLKTPFGLRNAPATFQWMMNEVLRPYIGKFVFCFIDDIIIYSQDALQHFYHLKLVLNALLHAGLRINAKKCKFFMTNISYLGHYISAKGVAVDPDKIKAIQEFPAPTTVRALRAFLGLAGYYHRYVRGFAQMSAPLTRLLKKGVAYAWSREQQEAMDKLKYSLTNAPILAYPDMAMPYVLYVDFCTEGIGGVLTQENDEGPPKVIAYGSRALRPAERNYAPVEGELLALVYFASVVWRHYLLGATYTVVTDHRCLQYLATMKLENGRMARWALRLMDVWPSKILYKKGASHNNADGLSRMAPFLPEHGQATATGLDPADEVDFPTVDSEPCPAFAPKLCLVITKQAPTDEAEAEVPAASQGLQLVNPQGTDPLDDRPPVDPNLPCAICKDPGDAAHMLICDGCQGGFHNFCLGLSSIPPEPEWFCPECASQLSQQAEADIAEIREMEEAGEEDESSSILDITQDMSVLHYLQTGAMPAADTPEAEKRRIRKRAQRYVYLEGRLYRKAQGSYGPRRVPEPIERVQLIHKLHSELGHVGVKGLVTLIYKRYWWKGVTEAVKAVLRQCMGCKVARDGVTLKVDHPLKPLHLTGLFQRWSMDLIAGLPKSKNGNRYLLTAICHWSRQPELRPIPDRKAETIKHFFMWEIEARYGLPEVLLTDNGTEFGGVFHEYLMQKNVRHHYTAVRSPQMNGLLERLHGTLEPRMTAALATETEGKSRREKKQVDWEDTLPEVLKGIRFCTQQATKYSPYFLLYGTEPRTSLDLLTYEGRPLEDPNLPADAIEQDAATEQTIADERSPSVDSACVAERAKLLNQTAAKVDENILKSQETMVKRHEKKRRADENLPAQIEDQVYIVLSKKAKGKACPKLDGPFTLKAYNQEKTLCNVQDREGRVWTERVEDIRYKP